MRFDHTRAIAVVLPGLAAYKQESALLGFIAEQGLTLVSVTADHRSALALTDAGLVDVVVVAVDTRLTDEMAAHMARHGGELAVVRPSPHRRVRENRAAATILRAAERGLSATDIAEILGLELPVVLDVLGSRIGARNRAPMGRRASGAPAGTYR